MQGARTIRASVAQTKRRRERCGTENPGVFDEERIAQGSYRVAVKTKADSLRE